jgi:hypothetical protein
MSSAQTETTVSYLTPLELLSATKFIGKVEPAIENQQFATFLLTVNGKPITLKCKGIPGREVKASQFNPGKLQLMFDVSGTGEMLFAAEQTKKEIQQVLDNECLPELDVTVSSWVKNKVMYLSWPRQRGNYKPILINGVKVRHGLDAYKAFEKDLETIGGVDDQVEVGFSLYAWALYGKNNDGTPNNKVTVGLTPTIEYINYKKP